MRQGDAVEHEAGEGDEVQAGEERGQALVVLRQAATARGPSEAPLHMR